MLGPLAVGNDFITTWNTWYRDGLSLHIIKPFDCVRDRLAAAIHWKDASSARQAAAVAKAQGVDVAAVREWCLGEGGATAVKLFEAYYSG